MRWRPLILNIVGYDVAWFGCVVGAAFGYAWAGIALAAANVALHMRWSPVVRREAALVFGGALVGVSADALMVVTGVYEYRPRPDGLSLEFLALFFAMWASFGTTMRIAMRFAWRRPWAGALLGLLGGPLAYLAAAKIGTITLPEGAAMWRSLAVIGVVYGVLTPVWVEWARRMFSGTGRAA